MNLNYNNKHSYYKILLIPENAWKNYKLKF